jgi:hypothetical protein
VALFASALALVPAAPAGATTYTVTTTADGGAGSLREAFTNASGNGTNDIIELQAGATYSVCATLGHADAGRSLTVNGHGATITRNCPSGGGGTATVRNYGAGTALTLRDLTVTMTATNTVTAGAVSSGSTATTELFLDNVDLPDNRNAAQGGAVFVSGGYLEISDSTITGNTAGVSGGGIMMQSPFPASGEALSITDSVITGNQAQITGGGIAVLGPGHTSIFGSDISDNETVSSTQGNGGGIFGGGGLTAFWSTFSNNRSGAPGSAIMTGQLDLFSSTVSGNRRSTTATVDPGGIIANGDVNASFNTIVGNVGFNLRIDGSGTFEAFGNVIGQSATNCWQTGTPGAVTTDGYNVEDDDDCGFGTGPGDRTDVADLGLLPLADNGGSGPTHHPTWTGGLVDAIPAGNASCASVLFGFDQRDVNRPVDDGCEPGAVEVDVHHPALLPAHGFSDVPAWVEDAVRWAVYLGYAEGFADHTYRPDLDINRAQVVRMLYRVAGSPDVSALPPHGLSDVPPWVETAVRWAVGAEPDPIMTGFGDNTFRPTTAISRAQVVRSLYRMAGSPNVSGYPPHGLSDVPPWVEDAVRWAVRDPAGSALPVMTGYADATFRPDLAITRGQVTRAVFRANP